MSIFPDDKLASLVLKDNLPEVPEALSPLTILTDPPSTRPPPPDKATKPPIEPFPAFTTTLLPVLVLDESPAPIEMSPACDGDEPVVMRSPPDVPTDDDPEPIRKLPEIGEFAVETEIFPL